MLIPGTIILRCKSRNRQYFDRSLTVQTESENFAMLSRENALTPSNRRLSDDDLLGAWASMAVALDRICKR